MPQQNMPIALILIVVAAFWSAPPAAAQPLDRDGLWLGGGIGIGHAAIDCSPCGRLFENDPWDGGLGVSGFFGIGRAFTPRILAGAELHLWARRNGSLNRDATLLSIGIGGRFYPAETLNLYLTTGLGLGYSIMAGGNGLIESPGFAVGIGAGYDVRLSSAFGLSPFARYVQIIGEGGTGSNQDLPARGPDHPGFFQFGLALMRY